MSYDYANQTNLIPQQLYSQTLDASQSIQIDNQGIVLGGNLLTTPIYASISQNGIITDNPNGFDILSDLNMNYQNINNVNTLNSTAGNDLTISSSNQMIMTSTDDFNITTDINFIVNSNASVILNGNGTYINTIGGGGGDGTIYAGSLTLNNSSSNNEINPSTITIDNSAPSGTASIGLNGAFALLSLSNGATTNTITALGYTTTNTSLSSTYYLNFTGSSSTGVGAIQKTAGISCNPSTNTITATTFNGNATTATNATNTSTTLTTTAGTYYPVFVSSNTTGNYPNLVGTMTYNPSTNTITANTFSGALSGTASNASAITLLTDNTSGTYYIPFSKNPAGSQRALYVDDTTGPLSYNPLTSTLSCSIVNATTLNGSSGINLQYNGTTIATTQSTGLAVSQINANGFNIYNGAFSPFSIATTTGISTFSNINTTGLVLPTTATLATFATSTLTITGSTNKTFMNFNVGFTGTTNTITTLSLSNFPVNAEYYVAIYNGGSGTLTINATSLGTGIKTTFASSVLVLTTGYAIMKINYIPFTTGGNIYVVSVNNVA